MHKSQTASMMANAALMRKLNGDVNLDDVEDAGDQKR